MRLGNQNTEQFCLEYEKLSLIQMECSYNGDYKKGNKVANKLLKLNELLEKDFDNYICVLDNLISSNNPNTIVWVSNVFFNKMYRIEDVEILLKKIATNEDLGVVRLSAEMLLKSKRQIK